MDPMNRRQFAATLSGLALLALTESESRAEAQESTKSAASANCTEPLLSDCKAFPYEALPVRYSDNGAPTRQILEGRIPGSEIIEIHETTLGAGKMPHAAHQHPHAELLLVRAGTIEFESDGPPVRVTAGGAAYCAPNKRHGFRNIGDGEATYFIVKIGSQPVCQK